MTQELRATAGVELTALRGRIERWRRTRRRSRPMPAPLWEEAVRLARDLGAYRVKVALNLNYASLKERLGGGGASGVTSSGFVEVSGAQLLTSGSVVEVSDGHGLQLTVRLAPGSVLDVAQLVAAFARRQP